MKIRAFRKQDKPELLRILDSNTPHFFHADEKQDYIEYLDNQIEKYFVLVDDDKVIGGGGINYFQESKTARISWDLLHPDYFHKGYGSMLLRHRMNVLHKDPSVRSVVVRTSQLASGFYQRAGFIPAGSAKDYWGPGLDLVEMCIHF